MMMKAPPAPALVVTQAEILLEVLVVALDTPTHLGLIDHALERRVFGQRGQPVLERRCVALGPLDEQPLGFAHLIAQVVPVRCAHSHAGEARTQLGVRSFAPRDGVPMLGPEFQGERLDRLRMVLRQSGTAQAQSRAEFANPAPATPIGRRRQGLAPRRPDRDAAGHTHAVAQAQRTQARAKRRVHAVAGIGQHAVPGRTLGQQMFDLLQRDGRLGRKLQRLGYAGLVAPCRVVGPLPGQVQRKRPANPILARSPVVC